MNGYKMLLWSSKSSAEVPFKSYWKINEALCSSCELKPEKFHVRQENMNGFRVLGVECCLYLPYKVFSGPQLGDVDTVPRFIRIYRSSLGLSGHENY